MSDLISLGAGTVVAPLMHTALRSMVSAATYSGMPSDPLTTYPAEPSVGVTDDIAYPGATTGGADFSFFIAEQQRVQREMLEVTLVSNVMKSRHETEMAPVRNVRVA